MSFRVMQHALARTPPSIHPPSTLHPRGEYPSNPAACTVHVFRWRQSTPGPKHAWQKASYHWDAGSPFARRHCSSHSVPLPPTPKSAQDFSHVGTGAGTACCPVAGRPTQSYAPTLCISLPPQHAELAVGNPVSPAQMDGLPFDRGRFSISRGQQRRATQ